MNLNEYQNTSRETAVYKNGIKTIDGLTYSILGLCGEAGELANKLKKAHRIGAAPDPMVLADELGDVLWYVASTAHELGMSLDEVAAMNLEKLRLRNAAKQITG